MAATWQSIDAFLSSHGVTFGAPTLGQTTGGGHVSGSAHYEGRARDYGNANSDTKAISAALEPFAQGANAPIVELFDGANNVWFKDGAAFTPSSALRLAHLNHVHVALRPGVSLTDDWVATPTPAGGIPVTPTSDPTKLTGALSTLSSRSTAMRATKVVIGFAVLVYAVGTVVES